MNARRGIELVILEIMRERSRLRDVLACALEPRCYVPNASHVRSIVAALKWSSTACRKALMWSC